MYSVPIFDSLTHPCFDSNWILPRYKGIASIDSLITQMQNNNVKWAFAVGMLGIGEYDVNKYVDFVYNKSSNNVQLFPIAYFHPSNKTMKEVKDEIRMMKNKGYVGIKLHPRISNFSYSIKIANIIQEASFQQMKVLLCTYPYANNMALYNSPELLMEMLNKTNNAKILLLHSGAVRVIEYMEIARAFENILLDLSLTLCKYEGSSVDLDLAYMFEKFDRRICVGSDFPEFSISTLRNRFEFFSKNLPFDKIENIAFKNIFKNYLTE